MYDKLSVAVLAGGASARMGRNKALLDIGGRPLVQHVVDRLSELTDDVFIVAKAPLPIEVRFAMDEFDEQTPLAGIITALGAAQHPFVFVCGCDMPFISIEFVGKLLDRAEEYEAAVPTYDEHFQSLHGVWAKVGREKLERLWAQGERAVFRAMQRLDIYTLNGAGYEKSFTNVNTPEDFAAIAPSPNGPPP